MIPDSVSAIILAGGQSRRMQREKSLLPVNGRILIETVIAQIRPYFSEIIISAVAKEKFAFLNLPIIEDEMQDQGPLMAIMSALRISAHAVNFILACDIPFIHIPFMQEILSLAHAHDIVVPRYRDGKFEPLFAAYNRRIIPVIEKQIKRGDRKISHLFPVCRTKFVAMDEQKWFRNLNTLKEYHDYLRQKKQNCPESGKESGLVPLPEEVLLNITVDGRHLSRLSCSPFGQRELVLGWLFGQSLIETAADVSAMEINGDQAFVSLSAEAGFRLKQYNPVQVTACSGGEVRPGLFENLPTVTRSYNFTLAQAIGLMEQLPRRAEMFKKHGGIHCSMLADMKEPSILVSWEDIGRSNSVDKVIGWGLTNGFDFGRTALLTTGRISAEMALKVLHAGIPTLISQTTLTSKALEIVRRTGLTLIGHVLKPRPILLNF